MAVSMTPRFNRGQIRQMVQPHRERMEKVVIMALQRAGEEFVKTARESVSGSLGLSSLIAGIESVATNPNTGEKTYTDRTGNLRSSIGYVILKDGEQFFGSTFDKVKEGDDGVREGAEQVKALAAEFPRGYVLIVVAGMDYAAAVESYGYDVLTGSAPAVEEMLRNAIERLKNKQVL